MAQCFTTTYRQLIVNLTTRYGLPANRPAAFAADGGVMSYALEETDLYRQAAGYVDRILRGEKPSNR